MKLLLAAMAFAFSPIGWAATPVDYIRANAIEFTEELPQALYANLATKDLVIIGEMHGTQEQPKRTFQIINELAKAQPLLVGLEFPINTQPELDRYFATGDENILRGIYFFQEPRYHSGRGSLAMIELMRNLRAFKNVKVFAFDVPDDFRGNDRDTQMAKNVLNIIAQNGNQKMLVYTGNIHSSLVIGHAWDARAITMGSEVLRLSEGKFTLQNTGNMQYRFVGGTAWYCMREASGAVTCDARPFGPVRSQYSTAVPFATYYLNEPELTEGHYNTVFIRELSASMPF